MLSKNTFEDVRPSACIVIPVHNRKTTTLNCLSHLATQGDLYTFQVVIVDDGSTDGTSQAVRTQYPQVRILKGDGNLWWAGAINLGMRYAYERGAEYIVWLNDDTLPLRGSIRFLVEQCKNLSPCILSGQAYESAALKVKTYGGQRHGLWRHHRVQADPHELRDCDSTSGNLVCLNRETIDDLGYLPSHELPHYEADMVYTWRAKRQGYRVAVVGQAISVCPFNTSEPSWLLGDMTPEQIWASFNSPKSSFYFRGYWNFCLIYWGTWGFLIFLKPYLTLLLISILRKLIPLSWLKSLKIIKNKSLHYLGTSL